MDLTEIQKQAKIEYEHELFREEVEKYKQKLRDKKSLWDRIFPWKILIIRKAK